MTDSKVFTFIVPGVPQADPIGRTRAGNRAEAGAPLSELGLGAHQQSVRLSAARAAGSEVRLTAKAGEDVVVVHLSGGPTLVLHPENARDLFAAQAAPTARGAVETAPIDRDSREVHVSPQLRWPAADELSEPSASRGLLSSVLLWAIEIFKGPAIKAAAGLSGDQLVKLFDAQVEPGLYQLRPDVLPKLKGSGSLIQGAVPAGADGGPLLIFIHGTFSTTQGTFAKLWTEHPRRVQTLFQRYRNRVFALDHATLGSSPIDNALSLLRQLPDRARVHLVTHSRGGLVAEVLARVCSGKPLDERDLGFFKGEAYARHRAALQEIAVKLKGRDIRVERVVRVACPARGTLLASKRLDAYISVLKWSLELAQIPVAPELVNFLGQVAQRRLDADAMPGLAAQVPDSPLIRWLHSAEAPIPGELRVIAGDIKGDSVVSWLKTLLSDAFYWTDHDLVVHTRSMYGGAPRADGASFLFDQGGNVTHFAYFKNERTADAVVEALLQDRPRDFRTIGPLSWAGEASDGLRAARPSEVEPTTRPAVFLLPGILGSHLKVDGTRVWLSSRIVAGLDRLAYTPAARNVEPDAPIAAFYSDLADHLARTHEVFEFAFDWRKPLEEEAKRLARGVAAALDARQGSGQPVRIVAHSMGGLLARTLQLVDPTLWKRLLERNGARVLMLGTPNAGSWAPMQVLSGDDTLGNTLSIAGAPFHEREARQLMAQFPGFLQLQAGLLDGQRELAKAETWERLAKLDEERLRNASWWHLEKFQLAFYGWGLPRQAVLDAAVSLQERLQKQGKELLAQHRDRILLVVGAADATPDGYEMGARGLLYVDVRDAGDGRVTHASALLPGVRTWKMHAPHGSLTNTRAAFEAVTELLERGDTRRLEPFVARMGRSASELPLAPRRQQRRSSRARDGLPPSDRSELLDVTAAPERASPQGGGQALAVSVVNGNLKFVRQPLLLGHYRSLMLTGTEHVIDALIGGTMAQCLQLRQYPSEPGSSAVFDNISHNPDNPLQLPRPQAAIVVGLGEEGVLDAAKLVHTVRQGVIAWAQRVVEQKDGSVGFELAATLIGSGGTGITAGQAAQLVAQGVHEANITLQQGSWPTVLHLQLIELYLDRATEAWRALQVQMQASPVRYRLSDRVEVGQGGRARPLEASYRGVRYDFITAVTQRDERGGPVIVYTLDTRRARTEVRAQSAQLSLVRELVATASNDRNQDAQIGATLFQLLVPVEMDPFLSGTSELLIELDQGTAGIPWELLEPPQGARASEDVRPWAVRTKLLRKLRTTHARSHVVDAGSDQYVFIVGEPACDPKRFPPLPGARAEAKAVCAGLAAPGLLDDSRVVSLIGDGDTGPGPDARSVITQLFAREYRIVHIAGHGVTPEQSKGRGGVVLTNGTLLGPSEIASMRVVPQLVFLNCCYLGARNPDQLLVEPALQYDRPAFAAGIAEKLIEIGVRCVVVAGWAVDDAAALAFATTFYAALLGGSRFIDAVAQAREVARQRGGNTWAAYQCYGDPDWRFSLGAVDLQPSSAGSDAFAGIASAQALILALETNTSQTKFEARTAASQQSDLRHLEARFASKWPRQGDVAEAFAHAWLAASDQERAIAWFERALAAPDGSASLRAAEQLGNARVRAAERRAQKHVERIGALLDSSRPGKKRRGSAATQRPTTELDNAQKELQATLQQLEQATAYLERLVELQGTQERFSLCGSAFKRRAMIEAARRDYRGSRTSAENAALQSMLEAYSKALALAVDTQDPELFYPGLNRMAAGLILQDSGLTPADLSGIEQSLVAKTRSAPDFWSVVGLCELRLYKAVADANLQAAWPSLQREYAALHDRVQAAWQWRSVYDQLRFVLPHYKARARDARERAAVDQALATLGGWLK